jgi:cytochrome oxidase Cu insertion factor (SCO1/SenC/PrrC family)
LEASQFPLEDRVAPDNRRPGAALIALVVIVIVATAWWALALWPAGNDMPAWLARTRAACFGTQDNGLPDAGGWILLIGEPLGMTAALIAMWGESLRADLRLVMQRSSLRWPMAILAIAVTAVFVTLGSRVYGALRLPEAATSRGIARAINSRAPLARLVDQHGSQVILGDPRQRPALVTFAFGHCSTVCPTSVNDLRTARGSTGVDILVVSLDPWRDTSDRLASLASHWRLAPNDQVLSGEVTAVESVLDQLGVARTRDENTGDITHATSVMLLDTQGNIAWRVDGGGNIARLILQAAR